MGLKGCDGTPTGGDGLCWLVFYRGEELVIACFRERESSYVAGNWAGCWNLEPEFSSQNGYYLQALKRGWL